MFIRVALPNKEEGIFNTDCSVALLLDTIKKQHHLPPQEEIDLCSEDGALKHLPSHLSGDSGATLFELRELCLVVRAIPSSGGAEDGTSDDGSPVTYAPVLKEYQNDEDFIAALNNNSGDGKHLGDYGKGRKKSSNRAANKPSTPEGGKNKQLAPAKVSHKQRRVSVVK